MANFLLLFVLHSVFFGVNPWQMLLFLLLLVLLQPSLTHPALKEVFCFRVNPWLIFCYRGKNQVKTDVSKRDEAKGLIKPEHHHCEHGG